MSDTKILTPDEVTAITNSALLRPLNSLEVAKVRISDAEVRAKLTEVEAERDALTQQVEALRQQRAQADAAALSMTSAFLFEEQKRKAVEAELAAADAALSARETPEGDPK